MLEAFTWFSADDQIGTELHQLLTLSLAQRRWLPRHDCGDLAFNAMHSLQRLVPAPLKLTGHQTIGGIDGIVLSTGMGGLVPRLLQRQLELSLRG